MVNGQDDSRSALYAWKIVEKVKVQRKDPVLACCRHLRRRAARYTVSGKRVYIILGITSSNTIRFSIFFFTVTISWKFAIKAISDPLIANFQEMGQRGRISKIDQYLMKLCQEYCRLFFSDTLYNALHEVHGLLLPCVYFSGLSSNDVFQHGQWPVSTVLSWPLSTSSRSTLLRTVSRSSGGQITSSYNRLRLWQYVCYKTGGVFRGSLRLDPRPLRWIFFPLIINVKKSGPATTATRYTMMAITMKTWKTNGVLLRKRRIHGHIPSFRKHVCGRNGLWPSLSNPEKNAIVWTLLKMYSWSV